jgi:hypothetical protein
MFAAKGSDGSILNCGVTAGDGFMAGICSLNCAADLPGGAGGSGNTWLGFVGTGAGVCEDRAAELAATRMKTKILITSSGLTFKDALLRRMIAERSGRLVSNFLW